jgi:signal transduction histidine kinase
MGAKMASILLLDPTRAWLELRASHGAGKAYRSKPALSVAESLLGIVVRRGKPIQVENVQTSARYQNISLARAEGLVSLLGVPLTYGRQTLGVLSVYTAVPHNFSNEEIHTLSALAGLSALAIERTRLHERIVDVEDQLRDAEKFSALGLLAAEVAHEIRNPLTVMKMLYHSLDLRFPEGDPRTRDSEIISEKMDRLNRIVEQILDFARSTEPQLVSVNVNQLIDLALNAVEAMPQGGRLTIATRALRSPRNAPRPTHLVIQFRDNGTGMTEEQQRRAFSSLLTTTKSKGTGLGLAIVARVVETHRGRVKLKSHLGRGTTFTIILPLEA